jgi:hypothetical protein
MQMLHQLEIVEVPLDSGLDIRCFADVERFEPRAPLSPKDIHARMIGHFAEVKDVTEAVPAPFEDYRTAPLHL